MQLGTAALRLLVLVLVVGAILLASFKYFYPLVDPSNVGLLATLIAIIFALLVESLFFRRRSGKDNGQE